MTLVLKQEGISVEAQPAACQKMYGLHIYETGGGFQSEQVRTGLTEGTQVSMW